MIGVLMRRLPDLLNSYATALAFIIVTTALLLMPVLVYIRVGWAYKSEDITNSISDGAKKIYLEKFHKLHVDTHNVPRVFFRIYFRRFGRRHFTCATIVITVLAILLSSLAVESFASLDLTIWGGDIPLNSTALSALAGAYMWVVSDFISRARRLDLHPADIMWGSLRLFISAPLGLSIGSILEPHAAPFVAFGLGAFPLEAILVALRRLSAERLKVDLGSTEESELRNLSGIDRAVAERLSNEDITTIVQLAYCDPIQMTMRTNLSFKAIEDLVSQSLAWNYLGNKLPSIRPLGLRGAYEIRAYVENLHSNDPSLQQMATGITPIIAERLAMPTEAVSNVFNEISDDPYTDFIFKTWD